MSNIKSKNKIKFSLIFSIFFLFFLTLIVTFTVLISFKPIKLDILSYFDRESEIFKKINIDEVGSVYLSFNKINKNFELLVENLVVDKSYFPSILIGIEPTLTNELFKTSLKVFDGDIELEIPKRTDAKFNDSGLRSVLFEKINFLEKFKNVELINNKITIQFDENDSISYVVDLNYKDSDIVFSISEIGELKNYFSLNFVKNNADSEIRLDFKRFNFDFIKYLTAIENVSFHKLFLSGSSKFKGEQSFNFKNSKIYGEKNNHDLDIIFEIPRYESIINIVTRINFKEKQKSKIFINMDTIHVSNLLNLWPNEFQDSVYSWMNANSRGLIQDVSVSSSIFDNLGKLSLNNLKGNFKFSKTEIKYMDSMPKILGINGQAEIKEDRIIFFIKDGMSDGLKLREGRVELFDLNTDFEKADINIDIVASNEKVINYLQTSPINPKSYSKLKKISGENLVNLKLSFPLLVDLPTEIIKYKSEVIIRQAEFRNIYQDFDIQNFEIDIEIDNSNIEYSGLGDLFGRLIEFEGKQINNNETVTEVITGNYNLDYNVLSSIIPEIDFSFDGNIDIRFTINEDDNGFSKIDGMGALDNLLIKSKFLGPDLNLENGKIRFLIRPYDKSYSGFLDIKASNLEVEINSIFVENKIIELDIDRLKSPQQDFSFNYKRNNNEFLFSGSKLTLDKINMSSDDKLDYEDIKLDFKIDLLKIGGMYFPNPEINFNKVNGIFEEMSINLDGEDDFHRILIYNENLSKKFVLESNYIPGLLNIFDIDLNINKGSLRIEGNKNNNSEEYEGAIAGKNIVFYDAPFLANFFSIFSLDGFAQQMKDGGIIFNEFNADYKLKDSKIKLIDSLLTGSELGIQFDSVIGLNDDYFLLNGSIIPAYTINTLITKFPIVGDIITAGSPEDGLIGANFRVEKIDGEYEVFYNPISVFVPNIIKNFLSD